jgi:hypothetical protein
VEITGQLICRNTTLTGKDSIGNALVADAIKAMDVYLDEGFTASMGAVRLSGAEIAGQLSFSDAKLMGKDSDGNALVAERVKAMDMFLDEGFTASIGAVQLSGAEIARALTCRDAKLMGKDNSGNTLVAHGMKASEMYLAGEFTIVGAVWLTGAQISDTLTWIPAAPVSGHVYLEGATVGHLEDSWTDERPNGYWPTDRRLHLDGFTYGRFSGNQQATVKERLAWIRSQYEPRAANSPVAFAAQPYEHLAAVYRQAGQDGRARKVSIARRADQRKYRDLNPYRWLGNWFLDWTIKYGYQTWRAAAGLVLVFMVFLVLSFLAQQHHLMVPVGDTDGLHYLPSATKCTSDYPCFYPFGYAIDTVIPIINVHQADNWGPYAPPPLGHAWVACTYVATGLGWALATLLVAGYTGLVRQD